ncbi:hypothetical protein HanIR_Chr03g0107091 [Helianthus annuus]|nr:hypothetical protein HanIR_Chr03g0107091 [Helianthus annuus]
MPTRMGFPSLWGMRLIKRFVVGPRFKNREGGIWRGAPTRVVRASLSSGRSCCSARA